MIKATVNYDGKQAILSLPDYAKVDTIIKCLYENLSKSVDFQRHVVQLYDPTIGEYFDLNDEGLKSWSNLSMKEKNPMRLQIIRATLDTDDEQKQSIVQDPMSNILKKIQNDIDALFSAIQNLQQTANGIRNDFQTAFEKYRATSHQQMSSKTPDKIQNRHPVDERPVYFPAEDIRLKTSTQNKPTNIVPLVSDVYQEDDDEHNPNDQTFQSSTLQTVDVQIPFLNIGEDFQALVSIAVNPSYFFVQNTFYTSDLERLAQTMNEYYAIAQPPSKPYRPAEMGFCAARYSVDDRWYRARVKRYNSDDTVEIVYIDYGNNEERTIHELRPLDPVFARLPAQAICVALELLPTASDNQNTWSKKASYKFHEDTLAKPIEVRITAQPTLQWPMYFVQVTIDEHTDIAETLVSLRLARRASLSEIVRNISPRLDLTDYTPYNLAKEVFQKLKKTQLEKPSISGTKNVFTGLSKRTMRPTATIPDTNFHLNENVGSCTITSIISPSSFFIQLTEKNQFEEIYTDLHESYLEKISCDRISRLKFHGTSALGVARNQRDQRFYRVQIVSHDRERKTLTVLCIDVGEYLTISDSSIYELSTDFQNIPAQAIHCSLGLIHPLTGDEWSRESINFVNRIMGGKTYKTFRFYSLSSNSGTIKTTDPPLSIVLFDPNGLPSSINEQLVEKKMVLADSNFQEIIRVVNETMSDVDSFKTERIRQYIESQRTYANQTEQNQSVIGPSLAIEDDEETPYCPPVVDPEPRHWYAVEVTHIKTPGEFYIRFPFGIDNTLGQGREPAPYPEEIDPNQLLNDLHRNMADFYSGEQKRTNNTAMSFERGQMVAVRYQSHWYRARVLEYKPSTSFAWVQFVDQGETRELGTTTMRPLHPKFMDLPLQAYLCHLDGFDSSFSWSPQDKDLFKKKTRDRILYAKKVREPDIVQLVDLVDGEFVNFESLWQKLRPKPQKTSIPITRVEQPIQNLKPIMPGLVNYASGSEYSQISSAMPKSSQAKRLGGATVPPPLLSSMVRAPMQFISAGFKQPAEYTHLSPDEQLAQFQQQEGHRIHSNNNHSISKHFRS